MKNLTIREIEQYSIAHELDLGPNDKLVSINGQEPKDIIEYRLLQTEEFIELYVQKADGREEIYEIEKEYDEDLGIIFEDPTLDSIKRCHNNCLFCFIDQLPQGMRSTLGVKDDDYRMSFMFGNYVTLTNLTDEDINRIITLNMSPLYISIHATDPETRVKLMGQKKAARIMEILTKLKENDIDFHGQLVLVPGINDGEILKKSLEDAKTLLPNLLSLSVVPVGLTEHRTNCYPLEKFNKETSREIINTTNLYQDIFKEICGYNTVYAADEFFVNADLPIPPVEYYEEYPQLENGVGIISTFLEDIKDLQVKLPKVLTKTKKFTLVTAKSPQRYVKVLEDALNEVGNLTADLIVVDNHFFGASITVAGLLTGTDILESLQKQEKPGTEIGEIIIPKAATKDDQLIFLDGLTVEELERHLKTKVHVVSSPLEIKDILGGI